MVKKGHNDLRDSDARIADVAWGGVAIEPILVPENDKKGRPMLQADWMVRGVWEGNRVAFFDNHIIDANAPSYAKANLSWESISAWAANAKKSKYRLAAEELRGSFTPLVCSTDGVLHREYIAYQKRLSCRLASKWQHGSVFMHNLRSFGQWTFDCVVPVGGSGVSACKMVQPSEWDTNAILCYLRM